MRIDLTTGELLVELLLEVRIEEMLHPLRGFVEVIGREVEIGFQEGFPQAVSADDVAGCCTALIG